MFFRITRWCLAGDDSDIDLLVVIKSKDYRIRPQLIRHACDIFLENRARRSMPWSNGLPNHQGFWLSRAILILRPMLRI